MENRSPMLAGVMNAIVPGLGHLYVGRAKRALSFLIGVEALCIALGQFNLFGTYEGFLLFYLLHAVIIFLMIDSYRIAKKYPQPAEKRYMNPFSYGFYAIAFLCISSLLGLYRAQIYGFDLFPMPDDAMAPAIVKDDIVLINARAYSNAAPKAGDVVLIQESSSQTVRRIKSVDYDSVEVIADDPNVVQTSFSINKSSIAGQASQILFSPRLFNMLMLRF